LNRRGVRIVVGDSHPGLPAAGIVDEYAKLTPVNELEFVTLKKSP
jgi:hypothetical protein